MRILMKVFLVFVTIAMVLPSCTKDKCERTTTFTEMTPIYMDYEAFRGAVSIEAPKDMVQPGKIYLKGQYLFISEIREGVHIFDLTNPSNPQNIAFVNIPGNIDIAAKGDILYADSFMDLVVLDISDPTNVSEVERVNDVFPVDWNRDIIYDEQGVVVDWKAEEVTREFDCSFDGRIDDGTILWAETSAVDASFDNSINLSQSSGEANFATTNAPGGNTGAGVGGSFARFAINGNHLYLVDSWQMYPFDISNTSNPVSSAAPFNIGWNVETIYPYKDNLFIGSQNGMFIYGLDNPDQPNYISEFAHVRSCDPVVVDDNYAYVTLRNGNPTCGGFENQLDIVDISNLSNPFLVKSYEMSNPHGVGIDGNSLFVCDDTEGLKIFDAGNVQDIDLVENYQDIQVTDVIPINYLDLLIAIGDQGFLIYDYKDMSDIKLMSEIRVD